MSFGIADEHLKALIVAAGSVAAQMVTYIPPDDREGPASVAQAYRVALRGVIAGFKDARMEDADG